MRYTIRYTSPLGEVLVRTLECASPQDARAHILAEGGFPLDVKQDASLSRRRGTIATESLIIYNQELLALLKAGIPLLQALELLLGHGKDPLLRASLEDVVKLLKEGVSYSEAMEQTGTFPAVYRANVVAGERSGAMSEVITRWLAFQRFALASRRRILEALFYPAFLVLAIFISLAVIFNIVLPRFDAILKGGNMEIPQATKILLAIGQFLKGTLWLQGAALIAVGFFIRWLITTDAGHRLGEKILLGIPKLGTLYRMYHSSVFSRTLSILLAGGMPALQALDVVQRTSSSVRLKTRLIHVSDMVRAGSSLHVALEQSRMLDPLAVEMIRVGEQSSALSEMLDHVADFFDQEVEKSTTAVTNLIGPVLILFMGVVVMGLLIAIYVPLFNASSAIR